MQPKPPKLPVITVLALSFALGCSGKRQSVGELADNSSSGSGDSSTSDEDGGIATGIASNGSDSAADTGSSGFDDSSAEGEATGPVTQGGDEDSISGEAVGGGSGDMTGGAGEFPDESLLDRNGPCILDTSDACGYPSGPFVPFVGGTFPNFTAFDCSGQEHEFAELLNPRPDIGTYNRGVVVHTYAAWSAPGFEKLGELTARVEEYRLDEVEILEIIIEGEQPDSVPDLSSCQQVQSEVGGSHPVWFVTDPSTVAWLTSNNTLLPQIIMMDANAHARSYLEGVFPITSVDSLVDDVIVWPYG